MRPFNSFPFFSISYKSLISRKKFYAIVHALRLVWMDNIQCGEWTVYGEWSRARTNTEMIVAGKMEKRTHARLSSNFICIYSERWWWANANWKGCCFTGNYVVGIENLNIFMRENVDLCGNNMHFYGGCYYMFVKIFLVWEY